MIYKIWIFYSNMILIRIHSDFELVLFVEKEGLFSYELVNKKAVSFATSYLRCQETKFVDCFG